MKSLLESKTVWKAVIVGFTGIMVAVFTELDLIGYIAIVNAVADIGLRFATNTGIEV